MSTIQWTDETWNPIVGCSKISEGCTNCYAATAAKSARLQQFDQYKFVSNWDGSVQLVESQIVKALGWKHPKSGKKVFVCSMADIFHENIPDEWRDKVFAIMASKPGHTFQVLTKRPQIALDYFSEMAARRYEISRQASNMGLSACWEDSFSLPPNIWMGVTTENNQVAQERIPLLLQIPAKIRWISVEPLLGDIDFDDIDFGLLSRELRECSILSKLDWVVVGGESGAGARTCDVEWIRSVVKQCEFANTPVFVKQLGQNSLKTRDRKGGDISEFPADLQIRQFPQ